ncbi:MAG: pirin family protein [Gemmatimonadota bacterium]
MITLHRAGDRHHDRGPRQEVWLTFSPQDQPDPLSHGFASLEIFAEGRLSPGASAPRHHPHEAEVITYVREGALAYEDSAGRSGVIHAGEFQRTTVGRGLRHRQTNASRADWAHVFQIWLRPSEAELEPNHEQRRFSMAERRGVLRIIASPDARRESLRLHLDACVFSALLDPGQHVVHPLSPGRSAWLHVVEGEATLGDDVLRAGDGAGVQTERAVSLTAQEETEILLLDLGQPLPRHLRSDRAPT